MVVLESAVLIAIVLGVLGVGTRMVIQVARGSGYPDNGVHFGCEVFLGAVAGFLAFTAGAVGEIELFVSGYLAVDIIEGIVGRFKPQEAKKKKK